MFHAGQKGGHWKEEKNSLCVPLQQDTQNEEEELQAAGREVAREVRLQDLPCPAAEQPQQDEARHSECSNYGMQGWEQPPAPGPAPGQQQQHKKAGVCSTRENKNWDWDYS